MFRKKIVTFLILFNISLGVLALAVNASVAAGSQTGLGSRILDGNEVAEIVYDAQADGTPKTSALSVQQIIANVINGLLSLLGVVFLVLIIYAGFLWMTAGGNDDQVRKAKQLLTNSIIGIVIIVAAYAISYFVINAITTIALELSPIKIAAGN